ncbi:MAG: protease inhibitor I42 family protein [Xanthobacteraceae bacterium]
MTGRSALVCLLVATAWLGGGVATRAPRALAQVQKSEQSVVLTVGARATVELTENPSTGYVWRFDAERSKNVGIVKVVDQGFSPPAADRPAVGAPGRHRWSLEGLSAGSAALLFVNLRPWEDRPVREHSVAVTVR